MIFLSVNVLLEILIQLYKVAIIGYGAAMETNTTILRVVDRVAVVRRLRECFKRPGAPQQQHISNVTGVSQPSLSQWLAGQIPEGAVLVTQVGCALGLRPDELYLADLRDRIRIRASAGLDDREAEQLDGLCQAGAALAEFTGPEGLRILKEHCQQLAVEFRRLSKIPPGTVIAKPEKAVKTYEPTDPKVVVQKMRKHGPGGRGRTGDGASIMAGEAPGEYRAKRDRAVKALIERVERSDGDVDTPAVGAPLIVSDEQSPYTPGTAQPEPAPTPGSSTSGHKPHATPKNRKKRNK